MIANINYISKLIKRKIYSAMFAIGEIPGKRPNEY